MQTRCRAAATALLLTAAAGMAATGGSAEASGTHHASAKAAPLTVTITSSRKAVKLSVDEFRPGKTTFKLVRGHMGGGMLQVLRLRKGYSLTHAFKDFGKAFGEPTGVKAVRRVDKYVVFYGGMPAPAKGARPNKWAVDIDHGGTYYVVNLRRGNVSPFSATGTHEWRPWPSADGKLNIARGNVWRPGSDNAHSGYMNTTNNASEPHLVDLEHVKKGTTTLDVAAYLDGGPSVLALDGAAADTGTISPRHTFRWKYSLPRGTYFAACFWPSKVDGTSHASMGMIDVFDLG